MPKSPEQLFDFLRALGIEVTTRTHEPLFTVTDSQLLRGEIAGAHTKNLFLKDKKDNYFLLTVEEEASVDLKTVHQLIGAASRVSFGKPEALEAIARRPAWRGDGVWSDQRYRGARARRHRCCAGGRAADQCTSAGQHGNDDDCLKRPAWHSSRRPATIRSS